MAPSANTYLCPWLPVSTLKKVNTMIPQQHVPRSVRKMTYSLVIPRFLNSYRNKKIKNIKK